MGGATSWSNCTASTRLWLANSAVGRIEVAVFVPIFASFSRCVSRIRVVRILLVAALVDFAVNMVDDVVDLFLALGESLREVICELFHVTCARILARSRRAESFDSARDLASERGDFISNIV